MALRKALSYSKKYTRPYTRHSKKKSKSYIKTVPQQKVVRFKMGAIKDFGDNKFKIIIKLLAGEKVLIRDNALEASRQYIHKILEENLQGSYYFGVEVYPHHILRENKMLTGAGADRMQTGMTNSFGTTIGRAAMLPENKEIFLIAVNTEKARKLAFAALERIKAKLPGRVRISMEIRK